MATCAAEQPDPVAHAGKPHPGFGFALQSAAVVGDANDESRPAPGRAGPARGAGVSNRSDTSIRVAPAWRNALVIASWTKR